MDPLTPVGPAEGDKAPAFTLRAHDGTRVSLTAQRGRWVVLFFYPQADTPLCTDEACAFNDALPRLHAAGASVLGVSPDPIAVLAEFHRKFRLGYPLLSDAGSRVSARYGVWGEKNLYGRVVIGMIRSTALIAPDGRIARWWKRVRVPGHAAKVAEELEGRVRARPAGAAAKPSPPTAGRR